MSISDFLNIVEMLNEANLPTIFVIGGIVFLFVAAGGSFGAKVTIDRVKPGVAGMIGLWLLLCGIVLFLTPIIVANAEAEEEPSSKTTQEIEKTVPAETVSASVTPSRTATPTMTPKPTVTQTPSATATPQLVAPNWFEPIQFCTGCTSSTIVIDLVPGSAKGYVLRILGGQTLTVTTDGAATVAILDSHGFQLPLSWSDDRRWEAYIPQTGDYKVIVGGNGRYTLTFYIPPLGSN